METPFNARHYKGGLYVVLMKAELENGLVPVFVYQSESDRRTWVRPQAEFDDIVEWQGKQMKRFEVVE